MHARMLSVVVLHVVFFIRTEYELYGCDALSDPNYGLIQITGLRSYIFLVKTPPPTLRRTEICRT